MRYSTCERSLSGNVKIVVITWFNLVIFFTLTFSYCLCMQCDCKYCIVLNQQFGSLVFGEFIRDGILNLSHTLLYQRHLRFSANLVVHLWALLSSCLLYINCILMKYLHSKYMCCAWFCVVLLKPMLKICYFCLLLVWLLCICNKSAH